MPTIPKRQHWVSKDTGAKLRYVFIVRALFQLNKYMSWVSLPYVIADPDVGTLGVPLGERIMIMNFNR